MLPRTEQSIKPYRPEPSLRERARQALAAEQESEAAERADALARAQRNLAGSLVVTCQRNLYVVIDPASVVVEIRENASAAWARPNPTIVVSAVVESIRFSVAMDAANAAKLSGAIPLGNLHAQPLCPVCGTALAERRLVLRLADLGRALGEIGCGCGWEPSA